MAENISLKPKFLLLNPNFDGYKLFSNSSEKVQSKTQEGLCRVNNNNSTCYLYTRLMSLYNHLFCDPFDECSTYVFNEKGHLQMFNYSEDASLQEPSVIWQSEIERSYSPESESTTLSFPFSLSFSSCCYAIISNGNTKLNILQTGDRGLAETWLNVHEATILPGIIVQSLLIETSVNFNLELHVLILSVSTLNEIRQKSQNCNLNYLSKNKSSESSINVVHWLSFGFDGNDWQMIRERRIAGFGALEYVSFEKTCSELSLLCHNSFAFIYDSNFPVEDICMDKDSPSLKYFYFHNEERLKLWMNFEPTVHKTDLHIQLTSCELKISLEEKLIFEKSFLHETAPDTLIWSLDSGCLEIGVSKSSKDLQWENVFKDGDKDGEKLDHDAMNETDGERLAHLTSDKLNPTPDLDKPAYNPGQLEACDTAHEDLLLMAFNGTTHAMSRLGQLGAVQHLFNGQASLSCVPSFCVRHDVDGLLYKYESFGCFEHDATFNAFGFVKASKMLAKFTAAPLDNSYVAICDVNSHIYIFCQPQSLSSNNQSLRNRKSGKLTDSIARQIVISLRDHGEVYGVQCCKSFIYVLHKESIYVYDVDFGL